MAWAEQHRPRPATPAETASSRRLVEAAAQFLDHPTTSRRESLETALRLYDAEAPGGTPGYRRNLARRALRAITPPPRSAPVS